MKKGRQDRIAETLTGIPSKHTYKGTVYQVIKLS